MHHSGNAIIYRCLLCKSKCKQAHTLKEHYKDVHHQSITIEFAKSKGETNNESESSGAKQKKQKKIQAKFTCDTCGTRCTGKSNLKRHLKRHIDSETKTVDVVDLQGERMKGDSISIGLTRESDEDEDKEKRKANRNLSSLKRTEPLHSPLGSSSKTVPTSSVIKSNGLVEVFKLNGFNLNAIFCFNMLNKYFQIFS